MKQKNSAGTQTSNNKQTSNTEKIKNVEYVRTQCFTPHLTNMSTDFCFHRITSCHSNGSIRPHCHVQPHVRHVPQCPPNVPLPVRGSEYRCSTWFLRSTRVHIQKKAFLLFQPFCREHGHHQQTDQTDRNIAIGCICIMHVMQFNNVCTLTETNS